MRKILVLEFITLDGVIQAPGGPEEDPSENFKYGGWVAPYDDETSGQMMETLLKPADLLLGRKTFEIWENYWPKHVEYWPTINEVTKYVLSHTREKSDWENSVFIETVSDIKKIKFSEGLDIHVWGSSEVVQMLLRHELVDEMWLMIHPVILGHGKRLFDDRANASAFTLKESIVTPKGVIIACYERAGEIKTGRVGT
ncbi:dihydrofolate reductase family protein [Algoriphagus jejuensis]|uniref:Dihydrofolate reductase family protein n=1 Tax=Algoriphagus jejuensis TaxID=419934 RepID=A0ABP3YD26_9BACT